MTSSLSSSALLFERMHLQPLAHEFDTLYRSEHRYGGFGRVVRTLDPALPGEVEPFSFLSGDLLHHIADELALRSDQTVADLGCGRGGPGLWLARRAGAELVGIDCSAVAVAQARHRAIAFGMQDRSRFVVNDLTATGLADASASAAVSIDALQYPVDRRAAVAEARRLLRRGGRLVLTGWHPRHADDLRVPPRHRVTDWPSVLRAGGFAEIGCHTRSVWDDAYLCIYRSALQIGDPGPDAGARRVAERGSATPARRPPAAAGRRHCGRRLNHRFKRLSVAAIAS